MSGSPRCDLGIGDQHILMSAGRSMATDLPMPSGMNRDVASLAATWMTGTCCGSAAVAGAIGANPAQASNAASDAPRINALIVKSPLVSMSPTSPRSFIAVWSWYSPQSG